MAPAVGNVAPRRCRYDAATLLQGDIDTGILLEIMHTFIEVRIPAVVDSDELAGLLADLQMAGSWESEGTVHLFWRSDKWAREFEDEIRSALSVLAVSEVPSIQVEEVPDQDWNSVWARSVQPILIGGQVLIRQSWNSGSVPPGGFELVLDPKRAFGTGYHATTQLLIEWLLSNVSGGERVLDVGTGSGVLLMVALRLNAGCALGIDIDPEAVECATEYAVVNRFGPELSLKVGSISDPLSGRFDIVTANLDRPTLLRHAALLVSYLAPRGKLAISGIQPDDLDEVSAVITAAGAKPSLRSVRDEWVALAFTSEQPSADVALYRPAQFQVNRASD